jgi:sRNA-binding carbon storage regulator CsrA
MALSLGLKKGEPLWFNDIKTEVTQITGPTRFKLKVYKAAMDEVFEVDNAVQVEILPGVFVQSGSSLQSNAVKIVIEAPQKIKIARDKVRQREIAEANGQSDD